MRTPASASRDRRLRYLAIALVLGGMIAALFLIPLPVFIFGPGAAVDLDGVVHVPDRVPPAGKLLLTDVRVFPGRPAYYAIARVLPGFEIVPRSFVAPPNVSDRALFRQLVDAMRESQQIAVVVAERAAGYKVLARNSFIVERRLPNTPGVRCFRLGDEIVTIDGKLPEHPDSLVRATVAKKAGSTFVLGVMRAGRRIAVQCATVTIGGKPRFGIAVEAKTEAYRTPVKVSFDTKGINGSSAGLMFALQIYRTLTGRALAHGAMVAGTGVLGFDGAVSAIEGTREKAQAAQRAGASVFIVPTVNYQEISHGMRMRVVPVSSFGDAVNALQRM